jgi:hypothetical protein
VGLRRKNKAEKQMAKNKKFVVQDVKTASYKPPLKIDSRSPFGRWPPKHQCS